MHSKHRTVLPIARKDHRKRKKILLSKWEAKINSGSTSELTCYRSSSLAFGLPLTRTLPVHLYNLPSAQHSVCLKNLLLLSSPFKNYSQAKLYLTKMYDIFQAVHTTPTWATTSETPMTCMPLAASLCTPIAYVVPSLWNALHRTAPGFGFAKEDIHNSFKWSW